MFRRLVVAVTGRGKPKPPAPGHLGYFRAIADAVDADQPLPVGPDEGRAAVEAVAAIYASAITGRPIDLPVDTDLPTYHGVTTEMYDGTAICDRVRARTQEGHGHG
jgi:hypothetical protein